MFGAMDWADALYGKAVEEAKKAEDKPKLPLWLPDIEIAMASGAMLDPFEEAKKMARGE